jgi:hypothetical protein
MINIGNQGMQGVIDNREKGGGGGGSSVLQVVKRAIRRPTCMLERGQ